MSVKLGGLWVNTDRNGNKYLGGNFGGFARIRVVKATFKESEGAPDYILYADEKTPKDEGDESDIEL